MIDIIKKKREGKVLSSKDIEKFVRMVKSEEVPDYQISAFLMAVYFQSMTVEETTELTRWMIETGLKFDLSDIKNTKVDKHSTGGVGDKISLILAPLAAELGITVPMISGRGLGHTGGTIDKLESIPGYRPELDFKKFKKVLKETRCSIISQTEDIAPVDKKTYAIRDVTATVESIPLITSSILSKKLSEDLDGLVIDLKVGEGAFMKDFDSARKLAEMMKKVGENLGTEMKIVFTDQSTPLGYNVGNAPEVLEAIDILKGKIIEDTTEVAVTLVREMAGISGIDEEVSEILNSGKAYPRFKKMVELHGGNLSEIKIHSNPVEVKSGREGIVQNINAYQIGIASMLTGAGRKEMGDKIDYMAGIRLLKKVGDRVEKEESLALIFTEEQPETVKEKIRASYTISREEKIPDSKIIEIW